MRVCMSLNLRGRLRVIGNYICHEIIDVNDIAYFKLICIADAYCTSHENYWIIFISQLYRSIE